MSNNIIIQNTVLTHFSSSDTPLNFESYTTNVNISECTFSYLTIKSILVILTCRSAELNNNCFFKNNVSGNCYTISYNCETLINYTSFNLTSDIFTSCYTSGSIGATFKCLSFDCNTSNTIALRENERCGFCVCQCTNAVNIRFLNIAGSSGDFIIDIFSSETEVNFEKVTLTRCSSKIAWIKNTNSNNSNIIFTDSMFASITGPAAFPISLSCRFERCGASGNEASIQTDTAFVEVEEIVGVQCIGRLSFRSSGYVKHKQHLVTFCFVAAFEGVN